MKLTAITMIPSVVHALRVIRDPDSFEEEGQEPAVNAKSVLLTNPINSAKAKTHVRTDCADSAQSIADLVSSTSVSSRMSWKKSKVKVGKKTVIYQDGGITWKQSAADFCQRLVFGENRERHHRGLVGTEYDLEVEVSKAKKKRQDVYRKLAEENTNDDIEMLVGEDRKAYWYNRFSGESFPVLENQPITLQHASMAPCKIAHMREGELEMLDLPYDHNTASLYGSMTEQSLNPFQ